MEGGKQGWDLHIKVNVSVPEGPRIDVLRSILLIARNVPRDPDAVRHLTVTTVERVKLAINGCGITSGRRAAGGVTDI